MTKPWKYLSQGLVEAISHGGVDDEVDGGVGDEEGVVEAGHAEVPGWWHECVRTFKNLVQHKELSTVQDNPSKNENS